MRVIVFGGTRFVGLSLVEQLVGHGHSVAVVHRGVHEPKDLPEVEHVHAERSSLGEHRRELLGFRPDAAVDMAAMTAADARAVADVLDASVPLVAASSADVYRACASVHEGKVTDPVPLAEDAALREGPPPDRDVVPPGWDYDATHYEKLDVERIYLDRGAAVCRLPMVYGEGDYKRREEFVLRRVRAGRERIPVGPGSFLWSRGYAPELARGIRLALEGGVEGEVFNLAEPACAPVRLWVEQIHAAAGHAAELARVPDEHLPEDLLLTSEIPQPWTIDSTKARERLGWIHAPWRECVERSVRWHLEHPPPAAEVAPDFGADDAALAFAA
ncbi:MAG TPA: NAD-dependent epimerase/dehydratase family protein [Solirubrobacterales bacterium]